jgi:hypothetical protein
MPPIEQRGQSFFAGCSPFVRLSSSSSFSSSPAAPGRPRKGWFSTKHLDYDYEDDDEDDCSSFSPGADGMLG